MRSRPRLATDDRDRGFTLIELLVVIIIIGILAAVAIPVFLNQRKKAGLAAVKSDLRHAATAIEADYTPGTGYGPGSGATVSSGVTLTRSGMSADDANFMAFMSACQATYFSCEYAQNPMYPNNLFMKYLSTWGTSNLGAGATLSPTDLTRAGYTGPTPVRVPATPPSGTADTESFCVQAHHSSDPTNIWRWSSANGGLAKGACP